MRGFLLEGLFRLWGPTGFFLLILRQRFGDSAQLEQVGEL